jgi:hypothetical protein
MVSKIARKKEYERFLLEQFFKALGQPLELIEEREGPDFIVRVDQELIGIELTALYLSHQSEKTLLQVHESISNRIISLAEKLYQESSAPPVHVTVCFKLESDLKRLNRNLVASSLVNFVRTKDLATWEHFDFHPSRQDESELLEGISFIHCLGVPSNDMSHWGVARAAWVANLATPTLQSRVDEKAKKLPDYRKAVLKNWLILVADIGKPSQAMRLGPDFDPTEIVSPFNRTFFYSRLDGSPTELGEYQ